MSFTSRRAEPDQCGVQIESYGRVPGASDRKRATAAASPRHVGVAKLEARPVHAFDVVDFGSVQVLEGEGIDVHLDPIRLKSLVHIGGTIFEVEVVLKPCTSTADDSETESLSGEAFR